MEKGRKRTTFSAQAGRRGIENLSGLSFGDSVFELLLPFSASCLIVTPMSYVQPFKTSL